MPLILVVGGLVTGACVVAGVTYYFTPKYARVGYQPIQPVSFSHDVHANQMGIDCKKRPDGSLVVSSDCLATRKPKEVRVVIDG